MAKFANVNEIKIPTFTDDELKSLLSNANEEELMYALGYHKKMTIKADKYKPFANNNVYIIQEVPVSEIYTSNKKEGLAA